MTSHTASIRSEAAAELFRGVRADMAMRWFGSALSRSDRASIGDNPEAYYALSQKVHRLDAFVSHEWMTGRTVKFLALCLVCNLHAAIFASCAVGVIGGVLELDQIAVLPKLEQLQFLAEDHAIVSYTICGRDYVFRRGFWCELLCPCAFTLVFFFWQRIRSLLMRRPLMLFVDRLCVHQGDDRMKTGGIRAMTKFLRKSDRMVIMWSPRFFTRLWCVYEVATWLILDKDPEAVKFLPMSLAASLVIFWALRYALLALRLLLLQAELPPIFDLIFAFPCYTYLLHVLRGVARGMRLTREQLTDFVVEGAGCFCCDHKHVHPRTQDTLVCDRVWVYRALRRWYGQDVGKDPKGRDHLRAFNRVVRTRLLWSATRGLGAGQLSYAEALTVALPFSFSILDNLAGGAELMGLNASMRFLGIRLLEIVGSLPLLIVAWSRGCVTFDGLVGRHVENLDGFGGWYVSRARMDTAVSCLVGLAFTVVLHLHDVVLRMAMASADWMLPGILGLLTCGISGLIFSAKLHMNKGEERTSRQGDEDDDLEDDDEDSLPPEPVGHEEKENEEEEKEAEEGQQEKRQALLLADGASGVGDPSRGPCSASDAAAAAANGPRSDAASFSSVVPRAAAGLTQPQAEGLTQPQQEGLTQPQLAGSKMPQAPLPSPALEGRKADETPERHAFFVV